MEISIYGDYKPHLKDQNWRRSFLVVLGNYQFVRQQVGIVELVHHARISMASPSLSSLVICQWDLCGAWKNHISGDQSNKSVPPTNLGPREICCCSIEKSTLVGRTNHGRWQATNPTRWPAQILTCRFIRTNSISSRNPK